MTIISLQGGQTRGGKKICFRGSYTKQLLKTESCYFNYGLSILSLILFSHTFISRPGDKSIVASQKLQSGSIRFSSLFLSSLGAPGPLVCSSTLRACTIRIGSGRNWYQAAAPSTDSMLPTLKAGKMKNQ